LDTIIGIDLGTTKSVVGIWKDGRPLIIPDKFGNTVIPSLVLVSPEGNIFVGREAQKHPERYSGKNITISSIKRLMGKEGETGWGWWKTYPQEVSAFILAELKRQAETYLGHEVNKAVIAIPSHFDESQRRATIEAAEIAGLTVVRLLNEATAAVLAYALEKENESKVMVINFGGGTFDVSIVHYGKEVYQVLAIEGDSKLGGDDFDQIIIDYILGEAHNKYGTYAELDAVQKTVIKEVAERAKIELSGVQTSSVHLPGFLKTDGGYCDLDMTINRRIIEDGAKNMLRRAESLVVKALECAHLIPTGLNDVLLLGGTSRIPVVRKFITAILGVEPITGVDPETCVAQGATIYSALLSGEKKDLLLLDVLPSSYGIGLTGGIFQQIIKKNTTIPTKKSEVFTTHENYQTTITINIYQGERAMASDNTFLGILELRDIPPAPAGMPKIEVAFDVDANMIVHVSAKDSSSGKEHSIMLRSPYGLSNAQIKVMQKKLKASEPSQRIAALKSRVRSTLPVIESLVSTAPQALNWNEISALKDSVKSLHELINKECSLEELQSAVSTAKILYDEAQQKIVRYETLRKRVSELCGKIDKSIPLLSRYDPKSASILTQGKELLGNYLKQNSPYDELQKLCSSVHMFYETAKTELVKLALENLVNSQPIMLWIKELENSLTDPILTARAYARIREISEMKSIEDMLNSEVFNNQEESPLTLLNQFAANSFHWVLLILAITTSTNSTATSAIGEICGDKSIESILAFCLLNLIDSKKVNERKKAAQRISRYLPEVRFIASVVNRIMTEQDIEVRSYLLEYIARQPEGLCKSIS
jgi:molecular chaperone DnaK